MTRLLVLGLGPLLAPGTRYMGGQCLRTWQFVRPLREAGHVVTLVTGPVDASLTSEKASRVGDGVEWLEHEGLKYAHFRHRSLKDQIWYLDQLLRDQPFEAIVAVNTWASELTYHLDTTLPVWADLNGWVMAEAQAKAAGTACDDGLRWNWRQERAVAMRADRFSTVSRAQRAALLGELAALGRLNAATFGEELVHPVANAAAPAHVAIGAKRLEAGQPLPVPRGTYVPPSAPVVLLAGGFNYWTDPAALLAILEHALAAHPAAHAVVTGGPIKGYGDDVYAAFQAAVDSSAYKPRIHLLGWLPAEEMLAWFGAATVGLSFDKPSLEAEFGARNRLTNMAASALAAVTTRGTEVAADLEAAGAGWFAAAGDAVALGAALANALGDPAEVFARGQRAHALATTLYQDARTVAPMLAWAAEPAHARDHAARLAALPAGASTRFWHHAPHNTLQRHEHLHLHEDAEALRYEAESLRRLRGKWPMRLWRRIKGRN